MESVTKLGPCGGDGGGSRDMDPNGVNRIVRVVVNHAWAVDSMSVLYERNGLQEWTDKWGGGGGQRAEIRLGKDEHFTGVSGHVGQYNGFHVVRSLAFVSNLRSFGPYGKEEGMAFTLPAGDGGKIVGFHGRSWALLDAIGTYVKKE